jgi:hypothetical protein
VVVSLAPVVVSLAPVVVTRQAFEATRLQRHCAARRGVEVVAT